jgi:predicted transcriptional regulator
MPCFNADGSISPTAEMVMRALLSPGSTADIMELTGLSLYRVRTGLNELVKEGLLSKNESLYQVTEKGLELLT